MERKSPTIKIWRRLLFVAYCLVMLWLLFIKNRQAGADWSQMGQNMNLIPLKTVKLYLNVFRDPHLAYLIPHAIVNLAGNVVMFIPLGFFLAAEYAPKFRFWKVLLTTLGVICIVEVAQLLLLVGSCDVDDLLLNLAGSLLGCIMYGVFSKYNKN